MALYSYLMISVGQLIPSKNMLFFHDLSSTVLFFFFLVLHHRIFLVFTALHDRVRMGLDLDLDLGFQNTNMNGFQNTHSLNKHEWVTNGGMEEMGHVSSKVVGAVGSRWRRSRCHTRQRDGCCSLGSGLCFGRDGCCCCCYCCCCCFCYCG